MRKAMITALLLGAASGAQAQGSDSITLYELPAYLGRSVTITEATTDLASQDFARKARSARVVGSWSVCQATNYATCRTVTTGDQPTLLVSGLDRKIVSLRPTAVATASATSGTSGTTATGIAAGAAAVNIADLDADPGTEGQDTAFFARPSLGRTEVAAGSNDRTAGDAFCKAAGYTSSVYAARGRTQAAGLIDLSNSTKVRAFPLRDVLCRR